MSFSFPSEILPYAEIRPSAAWFLLSYVAANQGGVNYVEYCSWARIGDNGQHVLDPSAPPQPCKQNSGISFAVPAKFIVDLAKKNNINLD
jgi:hypothetical protein